MGVPIVKGARELWGRQKSWPHQGPSRSWVDQSFQREVTRCQAVPQTRVHVSKGQAALPVTEFRGRLPGRGDLELSLA